MIDRGMLDYVMARIRPQIQADGGDVEITEVDDETGIVYVALQGACVDCPLSALTLSQGIERVLVEHVPGVERVLPDMERTDAMKPILDGPVYKSVEKDDDDDDDKDDDKDDDDDDERDEFLERYGRNPVRVTRVDEDGNITEGTL